MEQQNDLTSTSTSDDERNLSLNKNLSTPTESNEQTEEQNPSIKLTESNSNQNENNDTYPDSSPDKQHFQETTTTTESSEEELLLSPDPPIQDEEDKDKQEEEEEEEEEEVNESEDEPVAPPKSPQHEEEKEEEKEIDVIPLEESIPVERNHLEENNEQLNNNDDNPFHLSSTQSNQQDNDKPEEFKSQRDLDEEEIPPPNLSSRNSISSEKRLSQSSQPMIDNNDQQQPDEPDEPDEPEEQEEQEEQEEAEEQEDNEEEKENADPLKMNGEIHIEKLSFDQIDKKEVEINEEILPPLEPISIAQEILQDDILSDEILNENFVNENQSNENEEEKEEKEEKEEENPWENILSNGTLMKKINRKGRTNSRPTRSQLVQVNYSLLLVDKKTSEEKLIENVENEEFFVGETDIYSAIDLSVQSMDEGELSTIISDVRHVYGSEGFQEKGIPPKNDENDYQMIFHLELIQYLPAPNVEILSANQRLQWAEKKRQNGNLHYRRKDYSSSLQCYRGCLRFLDLENNPLRNDSTDDDQKKIIEQFIQVQNNVAQVNLILKRYDLCLNAVENVFKFDRDNIKALFRQGKSFFELGQYDQCRIPLRKILQLDPNHSDKDQILKMISISEQKLANYQQNEKEIYRRMFQPTTSSSSSTTTTTTTTMNSSKPKTRRNLVLKKSNSTTLWTYLGLGSLTLGLVGLFAYFKYRKPSSTF